MSICQSLVEASGTRVGAGPRPSGGALFFFEEPAAPAETHPMNPNPPVFVIDDEEPVRTSLAKLLRAIGFPSRVFPSATSYLESDAVGEDGCLLLDLRMPGMSGLDLVEELNRRAMTVPIIVMTGHADVKSVQRLEAFPLIGFLEKPFSVDQLKALLDRWRSPP